MSRVSVTPSSGGVYLQNRKLSPTPLNEWIGDRRSLLHSWVRSESRGRNLNGYFFRISAGLARLAPAQRPQRDLIGMDRDPPAKTGRP